MPLPDRWVFFEPRSILSDGVVSVEKAGAISIKHEVWLRRSFIDAAGTIGPKPKKKNLQGPSSSPLTPQIIVAATTQDCNKM